MIYPKLLKENDVIGICPLSAGVGHKINKFNKSIQTLKSFGYKVKETKSVRKNSLAAASPKQRVNELNSLVKDPKVRAIMLATGGDFEYETHPYIDYDLIKKNPKWYMGYSDPTNLLYPITCRLDIATVYGYNASSFDCQYLNEYDTSIIDFLSTGKMTNKSSNKHEHLDFYNDGDHILNTKTKYEGSCNVKGRLIGGCFEAINDMAGTKYDHTLDFINRYNREGIVWFFDIYGLNSTAVYIGLLKMKSLGYFKNTKAILVGRVLFENENNNLSYRNAFKKIFKSIPIITSCDIGHTYPSMPMIIGSTISAKVYKGKGIFKFMLN